MSEMFLLVLILIVVATLLLYFLLPLRQWVLLLVFYVVSARNFVEDLEEKFIDLEYRSEDIISRIKDAQREDLMRRPTDEVVTWLKDVESMNEEVRSIKAKLEQRCNFPGSIYSSYKTGRRATKTLEKVKDLYEKGRNLGRLTRALSPRPGQENTVASNLLTMESNLEKVLDHIAAGDTTVGILGMAGVGKTTLLKSIEKKLSGTDRNGVWFHHVIWVVVSSDSAVERLQKNIAAALCVELPDDTDLYSGVIFNFLNLKKFALLLDDIWEHLDLDAIGIPYQGRTVIFTTRSQEVCDQMVARMTVKMEYLDRDAAWDFFKKKVGDEVVRRNPEIESLAKEIANECEGLLPALVVIARIMSTKRTRAEWQFALSSLKQPFSLQRSSLS